MATNDWKARLATMLLSLGCVGAASAAELGPVPAILVVEDEPVATPEPICSVCAIVTRSKDDSSTAIMTITHERDFQGDVELVVWLDSDERVSLWIPAVTLAGGHQLDIEVDAGEGWGWDHVQFAWTRMHPAL
jgi:hypothetical protein